MPGILPDRHSPLFTRARFALSALLLLGSSPLAALEIACTLGEDTRYLRVDMPGKEHLCEVGVTYASGEQKVFWYADNDSTYCSTRVFELRDKYVDKLGFKCAVPDDREGINGLTARHRDILDTQIKAMTQRGLRNQPRFTVVSVRAVASTQKNNEAGALALQFFVAPPHDNSMSPDTAESPRAESDMTQVILDDVRSWRVLSTVDDLAERLDVDESFTIYNALIDKINDAGAVEVMTVLGVTEETADTAGTLCEGRQVLQWQADGSVRVRTPHRQVCYDGNGRSLGS